MKLRLLAFLVLFAGLPGLRAEPVAPSASTAAAYPLSTCVVSDEKLGDGDMGPPIDYIHQEAGKPDRLVRLCCRACIKSFKKDPAKYLKLIDEAAAKAASEKPAAAAPLADPAS